MLRFYFVIIVSIPWIIYYLSTARRYYNNLDRYSEEECYYFALKIINTLKKHGRIETKVFGTENLPESDGYIMFSNHQGKYDALGIMSVHKKPCTVVMDAKRSKMLLVNQFMKLIRGSRLDKTDMKSQVKTIMDIAKQVKEGRRFILFPEGGYDHNGNNVLEFSAGSFKCAQKAKCPIVPVAIVDSYIPFEVNSLKKVITQVHFLEPIHFNEYEHMTTREIADRVKQKIEARIEEFV